MGWVFNEGLTTSFLSSVELRHGMSINSFEWIVKYILPIFWVYLVEWLIVALWLRTLLTLLTLPFYPYPF
ncbi:hypothetical protein Lalb_Chr07g0178571 [Lupinus albus]|uniref:Uncharacterized protein n=1 Tax=Lupinus albus TaxID=3870 RepID=A0A6A4Q6V0_LUPAL|nr:hypothetical protein Lalb_Chr07g0178571 [Lupinus albus]